MPKCKDDQVNLAELGARGAESQIPRGDGEATLPGGLEEAAGPA